MNKKEFHKYVNTGMKLALGISLAVTSFVSIILLLIFYIAK